VTEIVAATDFAQDDILRLAAGVEKASEHPLPLAIAAADRKGIAVPQVSDFDSPTGTGVLGTVEGQRIVLGNAPSSRRTASTPLRCPNAPMRCAMMARRRST